MTELRQEIIHGDCIEVMWQHMDEGSVDLVFCSPPYENARTYGIDFDLAGEAWVHWAFERYLACLRVCRGLVAWVVGGKTKKFRWSATPVLLMAQLHQASVHLRKPPVFHRVGIPGSGGPDWLRNDYEFIICATNGGKLPWSDNTAMGHPPKWAPGGAMSHRLSDGARVNQWGSWSNGLAGGNNRTASGKRQTKGRPSHRRATGYDPPAKANPGNVIHCKVGGGQMGHPLCHENEAPFPEALAEFFIRSFCPPGGTVLDPFAGSGTTCAVAMNTGRGFVGIDIRQSQCDLARRRIYGELFAEEKT